MATNGGKGKTSASGMLIEGIKGALAVTDAVFMCRFYAEGYGDDMGNPIKEQLNLEQYKMHIKNI